MTINGIVQYISGFLPYRHLTVTLAPILVLFDGTIMDISTILLTMYCTHTSLMIIPRLWGEKCQNV